MQWVLNTEMYLEVHAVLNSAEIPPSRGNEVIPEDLVEEGTVGPEPEGTMAMDLVGADTAEDMVDTAAMAGMVMEEEEGVGVGETVEAEAVVAEQGRCFLSSQVVLSSSMPSQC